MGDVQTFEPTSVESVLDLHDYIQTMYSCYIINPRHQPQFGYELWAVVDDEQEFPVIQSNSSGKITFNSMSPSIGNPVALNEELCELVGLEFNRRMASGYPMRRNGQEINDVAESCYGHEPPHHELWLADALVSWAIEPENTWIPELMPIVALMNNYSEFEPPILEQRD